MVKIYKLKEYKKIDQMTEDFIKSFDKVINENKSEKDNSKDKNKIVKKIVNDLKLNFNLIGIFGAGIGAFYPIVNSLLSNMSIEITDEVIVLSTICALTIIYLEYCKSSEEREKVTSDSKTLLEELKLRGVGNGVIKKLIAAFESIKNIFSIISKSAGKVISGFVDMFSYTSILVPVMNAIYATIDKYDMNLENIVANFTGLAVGVATVSGKHIMTEIIDKIKSKVPVKKDKIIDEIETPKIQKFGDKTFGNEKDNQTEIIKES